MDSLTHFVFHNGDNTIKGGKHWINDFARHSKGFLETLFHTISNPDAQKWFLFTLCIPGSLFVLLSPGLIVNIPRVSLEKCALLVPLPAGSTGNCLNKNYIVGVDDILTQIQGAPICNQRNACHSFTSSEYTSTDSIVVHGLIFVIVLVIVRITLRAGGLAPTKGTT